MAKSVPEALRDLARACSALADALEAQPITREEPTKPSPKQKARPTRQAEAAPSFSARNLGAFDQAPEREGLTRAESKILTVLAQAGHALSATQIGTRCGLSSKTGSFGQALAALRGDSYIVGSSSSIRITDEGLEALGPFPRLPEGSELFDYWCHKVGGAGAKILAALRQRHRDRLGPASSADLGRMTGLSHGTGSFGQALAKLRRLELINGGGAAMVLSPELQRAVEITVGVFDRSTGKSVRVDRTGHVVPEKGGS